MVSKIEAKKFLDEVMDKKIRSIDRMPVGRAHTTYYFSTSNNQYVLKISENNRRFQVEGPVLELLNTKTEVNVPEIMDFDCTGSNHNFMYVISEFVKGENIDNWENPNGSKFSFLSSQRKKSALRSAGRELGKLHTQTDFDSFGHFKSENGELRFRQKEPWEDTFREIILEQQVSNFPERFDDLKPYVKDFVEDNIEVIESTSSPCVIHQDFRWPNILVEEEVKAIIDWERALAGHHEYDLFKAEESLLGFRTKKSRDKYRSYFLDSYRKFKDLSDGWRTRREFYRALRSVESLWTFEGWTEGMDKDRKDEMADYHRERLIDRISSFSN